MNPVRGEYGLEKSSPAETREPGSSDVISIRELRTFAVERPNGCLDHKQPTIVGRPSSATKTFEERPAHDTGCTAVDSIKLMSGEIAEQQTCSEVVPARAAELEDSRQ